jgi:hypothetical protein
MAIGFKPAGATPASITGCFRSVSRALIEKMQ